MRQAGRYLPEYRRIREKNTLLEMCERPELAAEVTLQPLRRFDLDAAILFADILLPARAMGVKLEFKKGEGPVLTPPVRGAAAIGRLREFEPREELSFVLEALRLIRRELDKPGAPALIGFAGAPFTVASYLVEGGPSDHYLRTKGLMHGEPRLWGKLMGKLSRVTIAYLSAQVEAGAQAVQLFDSWAGALSPEDYRRFVLPHSRAVISALKRKGIPVIHFGTGNSGFIEDFSAGADVVGIDWRLPLDAAWRRLGPVAVQGNLDPALLFAPKDELKAAVRGVLRRARGRRGHIFNLGHGILPGTPPESVRAVADWVHGMDER